MNKRGYSALLRSFAAALAVLLAIAAASCHSAPQPSPAVATPAGAATPTELPSPPAADDSPVSSPAPTAVVETVSTSFAMDDTLVLNPLVGWVTDARNTEIEQPHTLVFANFSWRDVESKKGQYDFSKFEAANYFSHWKSQNVKIILRLYLDYPRNSAHRDIPDWLYQEMKGSGTAYQNDYGQGFSPDYNNPLLREYHAKLVQAMAARYDNDPGIAFMEIGSLGHWGEWHTGYVNDVKIPFASQAVCREIAMQYVDSFKNKLLLMRRPIGTAADHNLGLFNDSFGDIGQTEDYFINWFLNGYWDIQTDVWDQAMPDFWKYAPSGGEVANYPGEQYFTDDRIGRTLEQLRASHTSWLGPSAPYVNPTAEVKRNLDAVHNEMGYRFYLAEATVDKHAVAGRALHVSVKVGNIGIAPFYYRWPVNLYLCDAAGQVKLNVTADFDIRSILPDAEASIPFELPLPAGLAGTYELKIGIADPDTGQPSIHFANQGKPTMMSIGSILVEEPAAGGQ